MSVQRISIDIPTWTAATVAGQLDPKANDRESIDRIGRLLSRIAGGILPAKLWLNTGGVQASGTIAFSSFVADDTVTINGNIFTAKANPSGANQWAVGATDEACRNNLVTKINASALDKIVGVLKASSRGTVLLSSFAAADTVTVNGVVFTCSATPTGANQFMLGADDSATAQYLLNAIAANPDGRVAGITVTRSTATLTFNYDGIMTLAASAHATVADTTIVLTSILPGQIGNLCTLAISAHGSVSGAVMTGGTEGTQTLFTALG